MAISPEPVVDRAVVDFDRLTDWMDSRELGTGPIVDIEVLGGGTQNVLLRFWRADRSYVLRRPPEHKRGNSDETMRREARILAGLAGSDVPHPALIAAEPEIDVLGAAFYLMEPIDGFIPTGWFPEAYRTDPSLAYRMGLSMADGIAALGRVDPVAAGIADLGRADGWLERQVERWRKQLVSYTEVPGYGEPDIPGVDLVASWLDANRPQSWQPGVIHGDYHFANVLMRHDEPALAAIVDWELATIGDPLLDLGHLIATWPGPGGDHGVMTVELAGLPTTIELIERYAAGSTRDVATVDWYAVLACYRLGILLEGTHARAVGGKVPKALGDQFHMITVGLFEQAQRRMAA